MGERWGRVPAGVPSAQAGVYRALSMNAGRGGVTTRKVDTIAKDAGRSVRRTQCHLRRLEELGWLTIRVNPGRKSTYIVHASRAPRQGLLDFPRAPIIPAKASPLARGAAAAGVTPLGRVTETAGGGDESGRGGVSKTSGVTPGERAASLGGRATSGHAASGQRSSSKEDYQRDKQEQTASPAGERDLEPLPPCASELARLAGVSDEVLFREHKRRPDQPEWILAALLAFEVARERRAVVRNPNAYFVKLTIGPEPPNDTLMARAKEMMRLWRAEQSKDNVDRIFRGAAG